MSRFGDVREQSADASIYPIVVARVETYKNGVWMGKHDRLIYPGGIIENLKPGVCGVKTAQDIRWLQTELHGDNNLGDC